MIQTTFPRVGTLDNAVDYIINEAKEHGESVEADFNGAPMMAVPSSTPAEVRIRYHHERTLIQIANGVVELRDVVDRRYIR